MSVRGVAGLWFAVGACGGAPGAAPPLEPAHEPAPDAPTTTAPNDDPEPDFRPRIATLRITDQPPALSGLLYEAELPWDYQEVGREGACRALSLGVPQCVPDCVPGEICVAEDQCAPYPRLLSAGTLTISGIDGVDALEPLDPPLYSAPVAALPDGDTVVRLEASGDELEPFVLQTAGVSPLILEGGEPVRAPGEDLVLRWTPEPGTRVRARFAVDFAHRLAPEVVVCDAPDQGELVVPGALLDRVTESPDWACGACLPHRVERYRGDRVDTDLVPVDLEVVSVVYVSPRL